MRVLELSSTPVCVHVAVALVGLVEISADWASIATQRDVDGHEICSGIDRESIARGVVHTAFAAVGFTLVTTCPILSTAAQNPLVGHEMLEKLAGLSYGA